LAYSEKVIPIYQLFTAANVTSSSSLDNRQKNQLPPLRTDLLWLSVGGISLANVTASQLKTFRSIV
jgi:hypothetical protein